MWYINTHLEQTSLDARNIQVSQLITWVINVLLVKEPKYDFLFIIKYNHNNNNEIILLIYLL